MIPVRVTDEAYNSLEWEYKDGSTIDKELEGYNILGAEPCIAWYRKNGEPAIDNVCLYLQKPDEAKIKVVAFDAGAIYEDKEGDIEPLTVAVAYIE